MTKNEKEAIKWYRRAAKQSEECAQYELGNMYYHGFGVTVNVAEAVKWYTLAAERDHGHARHMLRIMTN